MKKRAWWSSVACVFAVTAVFVACSDDESTPSGTPTNDGGFNLPDSNTTTTPPGEDPDAGDFVDGGGSDDLGDAGSDDAGLPDGGTCGPPLGNGADITSKCLDGRITRPIGGTIVAGDYDLVAYTFITNDCTTAPRPATWSGRLVVTSAGAGAFRFAERLTRGLRSLVRTVSGTPSGASIPVTLECGASTDATWTYTATVAADGKALLAIRHTVGTATIILGWRQR
jgi:hypothetical protein